MVFLHGIGLGLAPYTGFLDRVSASSLSSGGAGSGRTVIAVQYKHVSMRLTSQIPSATEVADDVAAVVTKLGFKRASVVAHSYGALAQVADMFGVGPAVGCSVKGPWSSGYASRHTRGTLRWLHIPTARPVAR